MGTIYCLTDLIEERRETYIPGISLTKKNPFYYRLTSQEISALLFICEYERPDLQKQVFADKIAFQIIRACNINHLLYQRGIDIDEENDWEINGKNNKMRVFKLDSVQDKSYFDYMLYENGEDNINNILDEALYYYIQAFYNQINGIEDLGLFESLRNSKKQAMALKNQNLVRILNQIEADNKLEFRPISWGKAKFSINL